RGTQILPPARTHANTIDAGPTNAFPNKKTWAPGTFTFDATPANTCHTSQQHKRTAGVARNLLRPFPIEGRATIELRSSLLKDEPRLSSLRTLRGVATDIGLFSLPSSTALRPPPTPAPDSTAA